MRYYYNDADACKFRFVVVLKSISQSNSLFLAVISEVITIDDEDDDPISEMKLNLHETYLKCQVSSGAGDLLGSLDSYSPTQSPVYVAPGSPDPSFPVVDLTSPYSPTQSPSHRLPPLPPLPPPVPSRLPTPPPPPSMSPIRMTLRGLNLPEPVPTTSTSSLASSQDILSKHGEPLPPGEDKDPASPPDLQDMDIDQGTEAETNFFLSQQNLFPSSVWDFSSTQRVQSGPRHSRESPTTEPTDENVTQQKKRKHEEVDTEESQTSQDETNDDEFEEEEASLRSLLLAQVGKNKKLAVEKEVNKNETEVCKEEKKNPNETSEVKLKPKSSSLSPQKKAKKLKQKDTKRANIKQSQVPGIKKLKSKSKPRPKQVKISNAEQRKYFPNLSRKVVVNFSGNESDSDSSDNDEIVGNENHSDQSKSNPVKDSLFGLDLEAFLKQARNSSEPIKTPEKENQMKVTKKIAMTPKLKAKASELTLADKKKLISAKITHLSKSKQLEYQRLKEILAKKQLEKKLKTQKTTGPPRPIVDQPKALEKSQSITEEEEEALRSNLIQNMGKSKKNETENVDDKGEKSKNETVKETSTGKEPMLSPQKTINTKPKLSIEFSPGKTREVKLNSPDKEDSEKLSKLETDVVEMRKSLSASLFKLSAYMSQLQKETSGVDSAVKYIAELKKQLEETEKLLSTREKKVESLREVIRESHQQITIQKQEMASVEDQCRSEGLKLHGAEYKPPVEGAENIKKKLEMIRNTAMKVKTTGTGLKSESNNSGEGKSGNNEGGAGGAGLGLFPGDYRSPLEHLSQANKPLVDHTKEVCRYDLSGKCLDPSCQMQHLSNI